MSNDISPDVLRVANKRQISTDEAEAACLRLQDGTYRIGKEIDTIFEGLDDDTIMNQGEFTQLLAGAKHTNASNLSSTDVGIFFDILDEDGNGKLDGSELSKLSSDGSTITDFDFWMILDNFSGDYVAPSGDGKTDGNGSSTITDTNGQTTDRTGKLTDQAIDLHAEKINEEIAKLGTDMGKLEDMLSDPNLSADDIVDILAGWEENYAKKGESIIERINDQWSDSTKVQELVAQKLTEAAANGNELATEMIARQMKSATIEDCGTSEAFMAELFKQFEDNPEVLAAVCEKYDGGYKQMIEDIDNEWAYSNFMGAGTNEIGKKYISQIEEAIMYQRVGSSDSNVTGGATVTESESSNTTTETVTDKTGHLTEQAVDLHAEKINAEIAKLGTDMGKLEDMLSDPNLTPDDIVDILAGWEEQYGKKGESIIERINDQWSDSSKVQKLVAQKLAEASSNGNQLATQMIAKQMKSATVEDCGTAEDFMAELFKQFEKNPQVLADVCDVYDGGYKQMKKDISSEMEYRGFLGIGLNKTGEKYLEMIDDAIKYQRY